MSAHGTSDPLPGGQALVRATLYEKALHGHHGGLVQTTPAAVATKGVALSREAFADMVQDFVAFNFAQEYNLPREALVTMLK